MNNLIRYLQDIHWVWFLLPLLSVLFIAFVPLLFSQKLGSPIDLLIAVVVQSIKKKWELNDITPEMIDRHIDIESAQLALRYLENQEREIRKAIETINIEDNNVEQKYLEEFPFRYEVGPKTNTSRLQVFRRLLISFAESISPWLEKSLELIVTIVATILVGIVVLFITRYVLTHPQEIINFLLTTFQQLFRQFLPLLPFWLLIFLLLKLLRFRKVEEMALEMGTSDWRFYSQVSTLTQIETERDRLHIMMSQVEEEIGNSSLTEADPDLAESRRDQAPVTPGIAELALATHSDVLLEMKARLSAVAKFHKRMAVSSSLAFFASLGFVLCASIFLKSNVYSSVFGGLGLGTVLGTFTIFTLRNVRTSNIAISLFESYLVELHYTLSEADEASTPAERRKLRSAAWSQFRKGLNSLWRAEKQNSLQFGKARKGET